MCLLSGARPKSKDTRHESDKDDIWFVWLSVTQFEKILDVKDDNPTYKVCVGSARHMNENLMVHCECEWWRGKLIKYSTKIDVKHVSKHSKVA
jgi:hypothetical protein